MTLKLAALAFAGVFTVSATQPPEALFVDIPQVVQIMCDRSAGTGFRVGTHAIVSVDHVTSDPGCKVNGEPVKVTHADGAKDFSVSRSVTYAEGLKINCDGFVDGQLYLAVGHARGLPVQRAMVVQASDEATRLASWKGFYVLIGDRFIPGMSGGPVFNKAGEVVGTVNGYSAIYPLSYARPLSETAICQGA